MSNIIQNIAGMADMTEQIIVSDALVGIKAGIKMYAGAIAESTNTNVRETLRKQLMVAIDAHEKVTKYAIDKGYYKPYDLKEQIQMDTNAVNNVLNLE
jgi:similar to spore coat protein